MGRAGTPLQLRTVTAGAVGLTFLLGACGGGTSDGQPAAVSDVSVTAAGAAAGSLPTDSPTDLVLPTQTATAVATAQPTATTGVAALRGTLVPRHFPFPKDATPRLVSMDAKATTVALGNVTADDAIRYYRQSMPSAGYTFQEQNAADGQTALTYVGYGQRVQIRAGGTGSAQQVTLVFTGG